MPKLNLSRVCRYICPPSSVVNCTPVCEAPTRVGVPAEQGPLPHRCHRAEPAPVINSIRSHLHQEHTVRQDDSRSPVTPHPSASPTETTMTHTIDFNDIYNLVETCVYIFLKRIVLFNSCLMDGMFFCTTNSVYNIPYVFSLKLRYFLVINLINLRLKTCGKLYTEFVVQKNMPSTRHELNKTILFRNM